MLGSYPTKLMGPAELTRSIEADLLPPDFSESSADRIDGALGEGSRFDSEFHYHADGVSLGTAVTPPGWVERLVPFAPTASNGVVGWCLEPHDLVVSKLVA